MTDLRCHLDPAAWVLPGKINAMENCARCDWGLTILSGEVNVRFIALLSLFDRTQGRVCGGKARRFVMFQRFILVRSVIL